MKSHARNDVADKLAHLKASGAMLLLRSPRLSVSLILELLDIGDAEFRQMCRDDPRFGRLLEARRNGSLEPESVEPMCCPGCGSWFLPYGGARQCSDECRQIARIEKASRG